LCNYNFSQLDNFDYLIHFASIGELNSINYLIENLSSKKILLTCSTLSSYALAKQKYQNYSVIFLPLDFRWNINKFLHHIKIKKIIWIDSEIWPNWLSISNNKNIKNILVNGRLSNKSFSRWKNFSSFSKLLGSKYSLIFTKGLEDKKKFEIIFDREVLYHGNLKFYQKLNLKNDKKNIICFASIHREEFENVIQIIENLDLNSIEQIIIIPRHIHFSSKLKTMMKSFYSNKIFIIEKFGENDVAYENSKLTFMGGSLIEHGGQNPIEPLSKGCFVLSGQYINNFSEIYTDLEDLSLAKVFNEKNNQEIGSAINKYIDMKLDNEAKIKDYFNLNIKQLSLIINKVEEC
jgi:3-deoxy-D-manno-octulosonic-acid transferase